MVMQSLMGHTLRHKVHPVQSSVTISAACVSGSKVIDWQRDARCYLNQNRTVLYTRVRLLQSLRVPDKITPCTCAYSATFIAITGALVTLKVWIQTW